MVRQERAHDLAAHGPAARRHEDEVEGAARERRRERPAEERLEAVVAVVVQMAQERRRRVVVRVGHIEVAADNWRQGPHGSPLPLLLPEPVDEQVQLQKPLAPRAVVKVQVHDRDHPAPDVDLGEKESLFPEPPLPEHDCLRLRYRKARQDRVPVAEVDQARPPVVDPEGGVPEPGVHTEVVQVVEAPGPDGALVHLLQGDQVRPELAQEAGNSPQVQAQLA